MKSGIRYTLLLLMLLLIAGNLFATTTSMPYSQSLSTYRTSVTGEISYTAALGLLVGSVVYALMHREMNSTLGMLLLGVVLFGALGVGDEWLRSMFGFTGALI